MMCWIISKSVHTDHLKLISVLCIIYGQRIYQKAFLNWLYQYLYFLIVANRFYPMEKCVVTPHCLYRESLVTLSLL